MRAIVIVEVSHGGAGIWHSAFGIRDSGFGDRGSGIGNRESGIRNQESGKPGPWVAWVLLAGRGGGTSQRGSA
ncbi:hypothetical protein EYR26_16780 [Xanthomonas oryzae]|nr:hypothetical protein EYR26_16780 [Xanthomonas oryzae]